MLWHLHKRDEHAASLLCFFFFFFGRMLDSSAAGDLAMGFNDKSSKSGLAFYHKTPSLVLITCDFNPV